ncbi:sensor histidine kinase [Streptomyces sp. NPDC048278]|uniref:sensor histidine kinase n=1 Tax=unclassified Streptomyces TaxID=2593676 RepID=UPI003424AB2F
MSTSWRHRAATHRKALDLSVLVLLFAVTFTGLLLTRALASGPLALWPGIALSALACAALHWRRSHPLTVLAGTALCTMAVGALDYLLTPLLMGPLLVAQYATSLRTPRRTGWNSALIVTGCVVASGLVFPSFLDSLVFSVVNPAAWILLCAALGSYRRVRREYAVARAEYSDRQREEEARHRVVQERMRIARELHDVVAHHLTLADAQAGAVKHLVRTRPDKAQEIIDRLPETTAAALRELKATVGLLREDTDPADDLAPAPGLDRLPDLVESCAAAGLQVTVTVEGQRCPLGHVRDLTAYRILQEALTNVTKHGAGRTAEVRLAYAPRRLTLTVTNATAPGRTPAPPGPDGGFGLISMRERATSAGGTFHAGHRTQGGFEVVCTLPLDTLPGSATDSDHESPAP